MAKVGILVVEDESIVAMDITRRLKSLGYEVHGHVLSGEDALLETEKHTPDLVLMDIHLKGEMDGIEAAQKIRKFFDIPVIYITAYSDEATLERAKVTEPFGYIIKPFQEREIHSAIEMAMYKHRAEQELREAKEAAVEGYRVRSEFIANISHELRTPLNSILGMTQLAMDAGEKEERNEYLQTVKKSGTHLLNLITSILDFSRMESGKIELVEEPFRLDEVIENELFNIWESEAPEEIALYTDIDEHSTFSLRGDPGRLSQVVQNLVHNAVKFTESGYVELRASTENVEKVGTVMLHVSVSDTGIGIPQTEKEDIFSMFYKLENSLTMVHGGTGLGLAIVKNLIEMMGGEISLESQKGRGSTFSFTVPMKVDREDMSISFSLPEGTHVHVVSDDTRRADIRKRQIEAWGADVEVHNNGVITGSAADIWCILFSSAAQTHFVRKLVQSGVPEEKIITLSSNKEPELKKPKGAQRLAFPVSRKVLFQSFKTAARASSTAAAAETKGVVGKEGREFEIDLSALGDTAIDNASNSNASKDDTVEAGYGRQASIGGVEIANELLQSFVRTAYELLEGGKYQEIEETALQVRQELEKYGGHEAKEDLFKIVLAGRKGKAQKIRNTLEALGKS